MRRLFLPLLALPLLGAEDGCSGTGSDDGSNFGGSGSTGSGDDGDDGGSGEDGGAGEDGGSGGGSGSEGGGDSGSESGGDSGGEDGSFVSTAVSCEGDNTEYTWRYEAEVDFAASYLTVTVDPETASYEAWYLEDQDGAGKRWAVEVTELLSDRSCDTPAHLLWEAFGYGEWSESTESSYEP